jgi:hypothetical protein
VRVGGIKSRRRFNEHRTPPDADDALEVMGELALVRESGARRDLCQGEVTVGLQELLRPLDAAREGRIPPELVKRIEGHNRERAAAKLAPPVALGLPER